MGNPLIEQGVLLDFASIRPEHVTPAMDELLDRARKALKEHLLSYPSHAGDQKALVTGVDLVEDLLQGSRKIVGVQ